MYLTYSTSIVTAGLLRCKCIYPRSSGHQCYLTRSFGVRPVHLPPGSRRFISEESCSKDGVPEVVPDC